jgi:hypothetical protein
LYNALLIIFVVSPTYLAITKRYRAIGYSFVLGGAASLALFVSIALLVQRWFFSLFLQFYLIAFDNEPWMLDPRTDNLIRMVPLVSSTTLFSELPETVSLQQFFSLSLEVFYFWLCQHPLPSGVAPSSQLRTRQEILPRVRDLAGTLALHTYHAAQGGDIES